VAVGYESDARNDPSWVRAEVARQRRIEVALRGVDAALAATYIYPRPGESVDSDVPRASVFARLIMEATAKHRIDLQRSFLVASSSAAIGGARVAGIPCGVLASALDPPPESVSLPRVRPDYSWSDFAAVRATVEGQRTQGADDRM
jgi:hypothetical protein